MAADPRVHYAVGYSGHGMGASALGGRVLASGTPEAVFNDETVMAAYMGKRSVPTSHD